MATQKNLHMNGYSNFNDNCQNLKATKMSAGKWVNSRTPRQWNIIQC